MRVFLSHDPFSGYAKLPQSQNGYSYVHNNPINKTDFSGKVVDVGHSEGGCLYSTNGTSCEQFVAEVKQIIEIVKQERECNPFLQILDERSLALDILAAYYSGIPFSKDVPLAFISLPPTSIPMYVPGFVPTESVFQQGTPDRWEVPALDWAPTFDWSHPINDANSDIGQSLRQEYGFKRPFFNQTHHYFAFLKFAYHLPDNIVWEYHKWAEEEHQLRGAYQLWQAHIGQADESDYEQYYAWIYRESVNDLYLMSSILIDADAIRQNSIDVLPTQLLKWCASNEKDVWSFESDVNQFYYEFPEEFLPPSKYRPN